MTGAETARLILENSGVHGVTIESVRGTLTDHYDPRTKTLRLSESVYSSDSLSAVGVAAHETGHAIQDEYCYAPLGLRSAIVPVVGIGSNLAWPIFLIGFFLSCSLLWLFAITRFATLYFFHKIFIFKKNTIFVAYMQKIKGYEN